MLISKDRMNGYQSPILHGFNENYSKPTVSGQTRRIYANSCQLLDPDSKYRPSNCDATCALLDFQSEGRYDPAFMEEKNRPVSLLACLQWTKNLHALLEDPKGLQLFECYLQQEGHIYTLSFWFACEGLKEENDPKKLTAIIKVLIRRFFQRSQLAFPEKVRKEITRCFREGHFDQHMFDSVQQQIERLIEETTYPNFLRSDIYLQYVQYCQNAKIVGNDGESSISFGQTIDKTNLDAVPPSNCPEYLMTLSSNLLPTLHEDGEFILQQSQQYLQDHQFVNIHHQHLIAADEKIPAKTATISDFNKREIRLTKDMLMVTQQFRAIDVIPKRKFCDGIYLQCGASPYHSPVPRAQYSSYNPVSRQDSELQSLSSGTRTESDNISLTDASLDGISITKRNTRKQNSKQYHVIKKSAMINRDPANHESIIPRTQRISREQTQSMNPELFARQLIERLESIKRNQENEEKLERKLQQVDISTIHSENLIESLSLFNVCGSVQHQQNSMLMCTNVQQHPSSKLGHALCEKLQLDEDSDQAILDEHVSRVWSDLTPTRSPNFFLPRTCSPQKYRHQQQQQQQYSNPQTSMYRSDRKERDVFSTFSGDSGNVNDFQETDELHGVCGMSSLGSYISQSKLVQSDNTESSYKQNHEIQAANIGNQNEGVARLSATKKSTTELTDSGVSVVSDIAPVGTKDRRLLNWLKETDVNASNSKTETNLSFKFSRKKSINLPQQPFVGDPGMPLLPQPHTATQLEEAKRRLEYEQNRSRLRHLCYNNENSAKHSYEYEIFLPVQSNQSIFRRGKQETVSDFTTVVFSFCDEKVPYRTKIAGYNVTLKQFKDVLPKKGSYRYFFKTECEDLDMKVIQEEITDDAEILPLWEGKVMAQVKALE